MGTLMEEIDKEVKYRETQLKNAKELKKIALTFPKEVQELSVGHLTVYSSKGGDISFHGGDATAKILKTWGVQGLRTALLFGQDSWYWKGGIIPTNVGEVSIKVYDATKPIGCRIEEHTETVTIYKAICEETGEEV